jgi:hypothetical protein
MRAACTVSVLLGLCYLFARLGASWYKLLVAAGLGVAFTQIAFLGHDAGHQQVFSARRGNDLMGLVVGDLVIGMSYGWWVEEHTRHHIYPNYEDKDPDIGEGVLAFTAAQARTRSGPVTRFIARHQAALFFPLLTLEGLNLRVLSAQAFACPARSPAPSRRDGAHPHAPDRLPDGGVPGATGGNGTRLRGGASGCLRRVHGLLVRPEPQGRANDRAR